MHTTQTVGLALATDLAPRESQPKVVALLCMMLLLGMVGSAVVFGLTLRNFSEVRLIQVIQGSALVTMALNGIALWKQEARDPSRTRGNCEPAKPNRELAVVQQRTQIAPSIGGIGTRHGGVQYAGHLTGAIRRSSACICASRQPRR